jgi:predicted GH43/DUF377 family glycosyl hydrolase
MSKKLFAVLILLCVSFLATAYYFRKDVKFFFTRQVSLCSSIKGLPYAEKKGIIKAVTTVTIPEISAPYNPSFIAQEDKFFLVFRHDVKERKKILGIPTPWKKKIPFGDLKMPLRTLISAVVLDRNFQAISPPVRIDTGSDFSEDPRIFSVKEDVYVTYNDIEDNAIESRTIHLAKLDTKTFKIHEHVNLEQNLQRIEKNWVPFVHEEEGDAQIYFSYCFQPRVILQMKDPKKNELTRLASSHYDAIQNIPWKDSWGVIRGGTPAILVDGQYLAFFHSFFKEKGKIWYVMGAYTFESAPPFRVTSCSAQPIRFKTMYKTKIKGSGSSRKPVIFPSGIVLAKKEGQDVIHVACGENDCAIQIITFDKEALLKSLKKVPLTHSSAIYTPKGGL